MQIPPTPTAMPIVQAPIEVDISLWDSAPDAVGFWNLLPEATATFQGIIILFIVGTFLLLFIRTINRITTDE